ncbi:MAG: pilus assembly protein [Lachnospiraceae bacterium]|nr:pilus assembly protein [Lachnospiraceae bacterium]
MWKWKLNNSGSITVEMSFIMPIVIGIVMLVIFTLISSRDDVQTQVDKYTELYLYSEEMIYGECSDRLRRWQFYGDAIFE